MKRKRLPLRWARKLHAKQSGKCAVAGCRAMKRPHIPIRWVRKMLAEQHGWCAVPGCRHAIEIYRGRRNFIVEHRVPRALLPAKKRDQLKNLELRCRPCADKKTRRPPSGGIGGDLFEIAKTKRLRRKHAVRKRSPQHRKAAPPKTIWPKRKLQSRGFQKRQK